MLKLILSLTLILSVALCAVPVSAGAEGSLRLLAVNVGKADALLLFSGEDTYLIDTGTAESWPMLQRALKVQGVTRLTGVILTHTHKDHAGGAWALAQSDIEIDHWYASAYYSEVKEKKHPAVLAAALRGQEVEWLRGGDELPLDGARLTALGPLEYTDVENCNSLVLLAEGGGGTMLLTGDMEFPEEQALMDAGLIEHFTVLKVGNHGNPDATLDSFAALVAPDVAVISTDSTVDTNTPSKRVLKALMATGSQVAVTQNAAQGVEVTLQGGSASAVLLPWPDTLPTAENGVLLRELSIEDDSITLYNSGSKAVDLSGWTIFSTKGKETFVFPEGASIAPGAALSVTGLSAEVQGDYQWPDKKLWNKKEEDIAQLYDSWGWLVSELSN